MAFDKDLLFKERLGEVELELEGFPDPIRLRALTRAEVTAAREAHSDGPRPQDVDMEGYENELVALSLVDPELTAEEVAQWASVAPAGELVRVIEKIRDVSALGEEAAKSGVRGNRRERRAAVRTGPRRAAGKDAGGAAHRTARAPE